MKKCFSVLAILFVLIQLGYSQAKPITYYLPDITYDKSIPTPQQFLGHQIGEWHITHDQSLAYMRMLAEKSDRVEIQEYARTHEDRPMVYLKISSPKNLKNQEEIRTTHLQLSEPSKSASLNTATMPIVLYQGFSIHGNEPSGGNAAPLVAYYLAAGQSQEVTNLLDNAFILLDPCYNPDGFTRFSTWANSHKGMNLITDPSSREYNEMWPGGRTNHYWFDLNRDWLLLVHPESRGRINTFHNWLPNVLTDHHEMGTNSTFFFQPGVASRTNPNTPVLNQTLTEEIGTYHAKALDAIGSQYYTKKNFDDFYYGKGSTYPDIHGSIGILFEQASSRGHLQESDNGLLSFPFTIRNQVVTALSTQKAANTMRQKLLDYQRNFYVEMANKAKQSSLKAYIYSDRDANKISKFNQILQAHQIKVEQVSKDATVKGKTYPAGQSYLVRMDQKQYGLIKSSFEKVTSFTDSLFYDVSAWTIPLAFDLKYDEVGSELGGISTSDITTLVPKGSVNSSGNVYAYVLPWTDMNTAAATYALQKKDIITKMSNMVLTFTSGNTKITVEKGSIIVPTENQVMTKTALATMMQEIAMTHGINVQSVTTGWSDNGISLGDPDVVKLEKPLPFTIIGNGVSSYDAGELWHYMDQRLHIPITMIDKNNLSRANLTRYNTMILVDGSYSDIPESTVANIESWIKSGGNVIAMKGGMAWLKSKGWINIKAVENVPSDKNATMLSYEAMEDAQGSKVVGGSIFNTTIDLTHPLCYGFGDSELAIFREGTSLYEVPANGYGTPVRYTNSPLLSGYVPRGFTDKAKNTSVLSTHAAGSGKLIAINDNILFRGYWFGGFRLFANALFFGDTLAGSSLNR